MNNPKVKLAIHIIVQILSQSAVQVLIPPQFAPIATAIVAILGIIVGFSDQTLAIAGGWSKPKA